MKTNKFESAEKQYTWINKMQLNKAEAIQNEIKTNIEYNYSCK